MEPGKKSKGASPMRATPPKAATAPSKGGATLKAKTSNKDRKKPKESPKSESSGARTSRKEGSFDSYLANHRKIAKESFRRLIKQPVSSLMTWAVIGIALSLPVGLSVLLANVQQLSSGWDGSAQITLFLKMDVSDKDASNLALELSTRATVAQADFISRDSALDEFKTLSGFGEVLNYLDENPLPHVIVVKPAKNLATVEQTDSLQKRLSDLKLVEKAQLDLQWVQRLHSMTELIQRGVWALALLLALAVLLVIGNTIRLAIENRRDEIVVVKLVGATDGFVRRPFLYTGLWYGLGGGLIAFCLVQITLFWLNTPISELAQLYYSSFSLSGLDLEATFFLLSMSMLLGWLGAWVAVRRHLGAIEPS
ncbi:permease-like cell division protein FtsX [Alkalimarinus alittae]|uniref:Cell division protein FtsX n=1 Tax=Alkalimarinus alittae TaxID=2961619 RepID=A0ABY6N3H2_9ALTE|nr:permease-like cell division protein FtsX [Alkalimarinus alittae]UZE96562.1 permease-like cell division protein FtsX [Alkalimarinus alittae]